MGFLKIYWLSPKENFHYYAALSDGIKLLSTTKNYSDTQLEKKTDLVRSAYNNLKQNITYDRVCQ